MYVCVCTQEKPIEIQSSFVLSSAECLSLYYFSLSRHPTALLSLSLSRSLFLSSTRKLTYVFACCSFLDEVKRECTSAREREKERKKEKRISCLPAAVCLILICSTKKEKKRKEKNAYIVIVNIDCSHNNNSEVLISSCLLLHFFFYCFYRKTGTTVSL